MKSGFLTRALRRLGYEPIRSKRSFFSAALASRLTSDWSTGSVSPTMELSGSLQTMRDRARDLERNNPLVRRYLNLVAENVVGHKGIRLQARNVLPGPDAKPNTQANTAIEMAFREWHQPEYCSVEGRLSWVGFQHLVMRTVARDGEAFVRMVQPFGDYGFAVQLIDADLVDADYSRAPGNGVNAIRLGVEVDQWGRPVAYHVFRGHLWDPTVGNRERVRIPATEILHLFAPRRPAQTRGESWLAPVMLNLRMLDGYAEAELVAARTAAAKMGFIQLGEEAEGPNPDDSQPQEMDAAPGVIDRLAKGETFASWDPTHPSGNFGAFVVQIEKIIAGGLNVAYASLSGDLREVNYSSIRAGLLQERDGWRALQCWLADQLCEPVYRQWREVAWMKGYLSLRMPPQEYKAHLWQPRGWAWIDPVKDVQAAALAVAFGFTSPQRVVGEDGEDFEEILAENETAQQLADDYGVTLMLPQGVTDGKDAAGGTGESAEQDDAPNGESGGDGKAGGRRRAHPGLAVLRSAG